jgi:hypothetical protein
VVPQDVIQRAVDPHGDPGGPGGGIAGRSGGGPFEVVAEVGAQGEVPVHGYRGFYPISVAVVGEGIAVCCEEDG